MPQLKRNRDNILKMNNFINWIAVNNTLMIRIGFTSILALLVIYVFRYFFLPRINVVNESLDSGGGNLDGKSDILDEADLEKRKAVEQKQAQYYNSEIEKLLIEVAKLKDQLFDTNTLVTDLKEKNLQLAQQANAKGEPQALGDGAILQGGGQTNAEYIISLKDKVESLEARLSEYEIIAEDISEIGRLRKENTELKKRLSSGENPIENASVEAPLSDELAQVDESPTETELPTDAQSAGEVLSDQGPIELVSEKEISSSERSLLEHFEETTKKKES